MAPESLSVPFEEAGYDNLQVGGFPYVTEPITLKAGNLKRGTVIAIDSTDGKAVIAVSGGANGTGTIKGILTRDTDASSEEIKTHMYVTGKFGQDKVDFNDLTFGEALRDLLRLRSIFIEKAVKEDGT